MADTLRVILFVFLCFAVIFSVNVFAEYEEAVWDISASEQYSVIASIQELEGEQDKLHLVISGSGKMKDFSSETDPPWYTAYAQRIVAVTVEKSVSYVGQNSFSALENLEELHIKYPATSFPVSSDNIIPSHTVIFAHIDSYAKEYSEEFSKNFTPTCSFSDAPCDVCGYKCTEGAPLCTSSGICTVCRTTHADTRTHTSDGVLLEEKPAGCEVSGRISHSHCKDCKISLDINANPTNNLEIPPKSHAFGEWIEPVSPDCVNPGNAGHFVCTSCGKIFDGEKNEIADTKIEPTGHSGGVATCTFKPVCFVCGSEYGKPEPNSHDYSAGTVYDEHTHANSCACGALSESVPHSYTETVLLPPTESDFGKKEKSCDCGYKVIEQIPNLNSSDDATEDTGEVGKIEDDNNKKTKIALIVVAVVLGAVTLGITAFVVTKVVLTKIKGEKDV